MLREETDHISLFELAGSQREGFFGHSPQLEHHHHLPHQPHQRQQPLHNQTQHYQDQQHHQDQHHQHHQPQQPQQVVAGGATEELLRELAETRRKLRVAQELSERMTQQARESRLQAAQVKQASSSATDSLLQLQQKMQQQVHEIGDLHAQVARLQGALSSQELAAESAASLQRQQARDLSEHKHTLAELTEESRSLADQNAQLSKGLKGQQTRCAELEASLRLSAQSVIDLESRSSQAQAKCTALAQALAAAREEADRNRAALEEREQQLQQQSRDLSSTHAAHAALQVTHRDAQSSLREASARLDSLQRQHDDLGERHGRLCAQWEGARQHLAQSQTSLQLEAKQRLDAVAAENALEQRALQQRVQDAERDEAAARRDAAALQERLAAAETEAARLHQQLRALASERDHAANQHDQRTRALEARLAASADGLQQAAATHAQALEAAQTALRRQREAHSALLDSVRREVEGALFLSSGGQFSPAWARLSLSEPPEEGAMGAHLMSPTLPASPLHPPPPSPSPRSHGSNAQLPLADPREIIAPLVERIRE